MRVAKLISLVALCSPAICTCRAETVERVIQDLAEVRHFSGPSMSPDGRFASWIEGMPGEKTGNRLFLLDTQKEASQALEVKVADSSEETSYVRIAWAPDSHHFAFLSRPRRGGQFQIFAASVEDPRPHPISHLNGYVRDLAWSHDGRYLAFLYAENGGGAGPLSAAAAQVGVIGSEIHNQRIAIISPEGGPVKQVTPRNLNVYEYDWSRDGKEFAAIAAPGPADNNWWIAKLYAADASNGDMKLVFAPSAQQQIAVPRWSPDGHSIAFVGGLMSDEGFIGGDVFISRAGNTRNLTPDVHFSASSLHWQDDAHLVVTADQDGGGAIYQLDLASSQTPERLWQGSDNLSLAGNFPDLAVSANLRSSVALRSNWQQAPEVWIGAVGAWSQATHVNRQQVAHWGKAESVNWTNGPYRAQGWLLYPEHFDPAKTYPLVVSVHGGPSSERSPAWPSTHFDMSVLSGFGYFVFFPNPRGSYGQGEAFTLANVQDFGHGDLSDIMTGIDAVLQRAPVDPNRLGITGWSYGGFMTMWTVTQTHRFHAAIAGAGIANWQSYYGENEIDQWMLPFFGASVYDDPAVYARSSPINYIKNVTTPTLVLVGERDAECPAPQSFEFWHALNTLNVPTQLVVYPGEGHSFDLPKDNIDRTQRVIDWFNQYLH